MESNMDIIEYIEKVCGINLMERQKEMLRLYSALPKDCTVVMRRSGPVILDKNGDKIGELNNHGVSTALLGKHANFVYVDEMHGVIKE